MPSFILRNNINVRTLVNDDDALQDGILNAWEQYNTEQHVTVTPPGLDYQVIISKYNKVGDWYLDPRLKKSFTFDHMRLVADDLEFMKWMILWTNYGKAAIDDEALKYVNDHYPDGVLSVYTNEQQIILAIVDNKYNPNNFWNGKWLAVWSYDTQSSELKGTTKVNVHYYEDGNVQLNTDKQFESSITKNEDVSKLAATIIKDIAAFDKRYQSAMNDSYNDLAEDTFKGLRRALPLTRNKLDWNKILNYKIGNELAQK
ncbi:unnamed protein product [Absidia cylindrospora]